MLNRKKIFLIAFLVVFFLSLNGFAFAQRELEIDYPEIGGQKPETTSVGLSQYVKYAFNFSIAISGIVIFGILIYAGLRYFFSADSVVAKAEAKKRIGNAALGFLILFGSYLILTTVNPQLTFLDFPALTKNIFTLPQDQAKEEPALKAQEIPLGYLIEKMVSEEKDKEKIKEGIFAETRLLRLQSLYKNINSKAKELNILNDQLKILGENLKKISDACDCKLTSVDQGNSCSFDLAKVPCPVTGKRPEKTGFCKNGDVCQNQKPAVEELSRQINQKRKEIFVLIYSGAGEKTEISEGMKDLYFPDDQPGLDILLKGESADYELGLLSWQKGLDYELKDFQAILGEWTNARDAIYNCQNQGGNKGHILLNYYDFDRYRKTLRDAGQKEIEVVPWPNARPSQDTSTFYCVEQDAGGLVLGAPPADLLKEIIWPGEEEVFEETGAVCKEVIAGKLFDDTDNLGRKVLTELQLLYQQTNAITQNAMAILNVEDLKLLIDEITSYNCNNNCYPWEEPYLVCWYETITDSEGNSVSVKRCRTEIDKCCVIGKPPASAQRDDTKKGCSWYSPVYSCADTPGTIKNPAPQKDIRDRVSLFASRSAVIKSSQIDINDNIIPRLKDLLAKAIEFKADDTKIKGEIYKDLQSIKQNIQDPLCSISQQEWQDFLDDKKIIEKGFFSWQEVQVRGWVENPTENSFYCCQRKAVVK
ncbi:MAG: pilin [bacterium]